MVDVPLGVKEGKEREKEVPPEIAAYVQQKSVIYA